MNTNGTRIRQLRERKGLKQIEMAYFLNLSQAQLSKIESGFTQPKLEILIRIADYLEVDIKDLTDDYISTSSSSINTQHTEPIILKEYILKLEKLIEQKDVIIKSLTQNDSNK